MRFRSSVLVFVGCNRVLALPSIGERDAAFFDAPIDAPFACPDYGNVPAFDHGSLVQERDAACFHFTISDDRKHGLATCATDSFAGPVYEIDANDALVPAPGLTPTATVSFQQPRIAPDGTHATVLRVTTVNSAVTVDVLVVQRDATGWAPIATLVSDSKVASVSQVTREPGAHVLVAYGAGFTDIHEFVETSSGWEDRITFQLPSYLADELELSPDGLHLWFAANDQVIYADRPTIDAAFVERGPIPGTDAFPTPFIAPDCGRVYFTTLDRIWSAPRR